MLTKAVRQPYTMLELQQCAEREVGYRRRVYANRVMTSRMTRQQADREIALMTQIADHFAELAKQEQLL